MEQFTVTSRRCGLIGHTESSTCPHSGNGDETAEHLLHQRYFGDSTDIKDVFQNSLPVSLSDQSLIPTFFYCQLRSEDVSLRQSIRFICTLVTVIRCYLIYTVSQKKLCQLIFCSLSVRYAPISLKIGRVVPEDTFNKTGLVEFLISSGHLSPHIGSA